MKKSACYHPLLLVMSFIYLLLGWTLTVSAEIQPTFKRQVGVPPITVLKTILQANQRATKSPENKQQTEQTPPLITWLADSDSKIMPQMILREPEGKIYSVRTLGFQMETVKESIDFGILELLTPVLLITGDSGNQAIKLFMMDQGQAATVLGRVNESFKTSLAGQLSDNNTDDPTFEDRLLENIEANIDYQVNEAVKRYQERIKAGRLLVAGGIIDLHNQYGRGFKKLIITNINGEGNDYCLKQMPLMRQIDPETMTLAIGRNRTGKENERVPCRN